ncbi:MAG: hypothetical protein PHW74_04980 [Desulfobacca sp.]|nr:hypothetical protein [Desulfobacca sp.]
MKDIRPLRSHRQDSWIDLPAEEKLDRALVAGLLLEVILETPTLPNNIQTRQQLIRSRLKNYLVQNLAGKVTLERFRTLTRRLEQWFEFYYPLLSSDFNHPQPAYQVNEPAVEYHLETKKSLTPLPDQVFWDELLDRWLETLRPSLPHRSHRKLSLEKLKEFLQRSAGGWFRLREFEKFFGLDRKTAWDYLHQFLETGLLCHNRKKSAAVRYCVAPQVLKVEADILRLALMLVLPDLEEGALDLIGDLLIATGGEPFCPEDWEKYWPPGQLANIYAKLIAHKILVTEIGPSGKRQLRLRHRWLQTQTEIDTTGPEDIPLDGD